MIDSIDFLVAKQGQATPSLSEERVPLKGVMLISYHINRMTKKEKMGQKFRKKAKEEVICTSVGVHGEQELRLQKPQLWVALRHPLLEIHQKEC